MKKDNIYRALLYLKYLKRCGRLSASQFDQKYAEIFAQLEHENSANTQGGDLDNQADPDNTDIDTGQELRRLLVTQNDLSPQSWSSVQTRELPGWLQKPLFNEEISALMGICLTEQEDLDDLEAIIFMPDSHYDIMLSQPSHTTTEPSNEQRQIINPVKHHTSRIEEQKPITPCSTLPDIEPPPSLPTHSLSTKPLPSRPIEGKLRPPRPRKIDSTPQIITVKYSLPQIPNAGYKIDPEYKQDLKPRQHKNVSLSFSSDGRFLASSIQDNSITFMESGSWRLLHKNKASDAEITALDWHPNSKWLAYSDAKGWIHVHDFIANKMLCKIELQDRCHILVWTANNNNLCAVSANGHIVTWDVERNKLMHSNTAQNNNVTAVAIDHACSRIAFADTTNHIHVSEIDSLDFVTSKPSILSPILTMAFHPLQLKLFSIDSTGLLQVWDLFENGLIYQPNGLCRIKCEFSPQIQISQHGKWLTFVGREREIAIHSTKDGQLLYTFTQHVDNIAISPDNLWIAVASAQSGLNFMSSTCFAFR
jgi:WD40 repeat protein